MTMHGGSNSWHLVRRLLSLRKLRLDLLNPGLNIGDGAHRQTQPGNDSDLRYAACSIVYDGSAQAEVQHPVNDAQFGVDVGELNRQGRGLNDGMLNAANYHVFQRGFGVGHSLPLDELNQAFARSLARESTP